ncbi:hypothetical protein K492DRAFT_234719 [Lichtheimia hyalospora FSU 10163]|nr:hypothetical protein K492DRAFT_234719 [Lichtheimia hyalospora FSU 10163]
MKFTSLLSAVLVFALSAVNAKKEPAVIQFRPAPRTSPPSYVIQIDLLSSHILQEIMLRTKAPNYLADVPERSHGVVDYSELPDGVFDVIINDNDANGVEKTFRIDIGGPEVKFHYEGTSVTDEQIKELQADGYGGTIERY